MGQHLLDLALLLCCCGRTACACIGTGAVVFLQQDHVVGSLAKRGEHALHVRLHPLQALPVVLRATLCAAALELQSVHQGLGVLVEVEDLLPEALQGGALHAQTVSSHGLV